MTQQIAARNPAAPALTTRLQLPASVASVRNSMMNRGAKWYRDPLTEEAKSWITRRLSQLDRLLASPVDDASAGKPLLMLFAAFPASAMSDEMAKAKVAGYRLALRDFPVWAIERAVEKWICGEADETAKFAPSPPELKATCRAVFDAAVAERTSWNMLLQAEEKAHIPPAPADRAKPGLKGALTDRRLPTVDIAAVIDAAQQRPRVTPQARPMPEAERRLVEAMAAGATITDDMIAAAERGASD
jgi:hypothetical protein